jgi:hypothetical protein
MQLYASVIFLISLLLSDGVCNVSCCSHRNMSNYLCSFSFPVIHYIINFDLRSQFR